MSRPLRAPGDAWVIALPAVHCNPGSAALQSTVFHCKWQIQRPHRALRFDLDANLSDFVYASRSCEARSATLNKI